MTGGAREAKRPTNFLEGHLLVGMTKKWDNLLTEVTFCCRQSSEREKFVLVTKDLRQRKLNVLLQGENRGGVGSGCWSGFEVLVVLMVSQDKSTQRRWDKNQEVGGREDRVRSDRIPLAELISRLAIHRSNGREAGSVRSAA